jgi:hypothetical protein
MGTRWHGKHALPARRRQDCSVRQPGDLDKETHGFAPRSCDQFAFLAELSLRSADEKSYSKRTLIPADVKRRVLESTGPHFGIGIRLKTTFSRTDQRHGEFDTGSG